MNARTCNDAAFATGPVPSSSAVHVYRSHHGDVDWHSVSLRHLMRPPLGRFLHVQSTYQSFHGAPQRRQRGWITQMQPCCTFIATLSCTRVCPCMRRHCVRATQVRRGHFFLNCSSMPFFSCTHD